MYFSNFGTFNQAIEKATRFAFQAVLIDGTVKTSTSFPKEGYPQAFEALASFHEQRVPFLMWSTLPEEIVAIPYEQIRTLTLKVIA